MDKPLVIKHIPGGIAELRLDMGFDDVSVNARNFLSQIGHLVDYNGPDSKEIVFLMDGRSLQQSVEWGIDLRTTLGRLRELSPEVPVNVLRMFANRLHAKTWRSMSATQEPGRYSSWMSKHRDFWTRLRSVQTLWCLRGFGKVIYSSKLPGGLITATNRRSETWTELARFAGFVPEAETPHVRLVKSWSAEMVVREVQELYRRKLPFSPSWLKKHGYGRLLNAAKTHIGSWEAAIRASGLDPYDLMEWKWNLLSPEQVLAEIMKRQSLGNSLAEVQVSQDWRDLVFSARYHFGNWREAVDAVGIDPLDPSVKHTKRWSSEAVTSTIRKIKLGGEPIYDRYLALHYPAVLAATGVYYGSWKGAVSAAGFDPEVERKHQSWSQAKVLRLIKALKEAGEPLNPGYLHKNHLTLEAAMRQWFGTWEAAIRAAGFDPVEERENQPRSPSQVIAELRRIKEAGELLYAEYLKKNHNWVYQSGRFYFGSVAKALEAAGIDPKEETFHSLRTRQVLEGLQTLKRQGKPVNAKYLQLHHHHLYEGAKRYFGSWAVAIRAAGFDPSDEAIKGFWNQDKVIAEIHRLKKIGEPLYHRYLQTNHLSLYGAMFHYFGSWEAAIRAAGLIPYNERRNNKVSQEEVVAQIKAIKEGGNPLSPSHVIRYCGPLYARARRRFGSWEAAVQAAGFDPRQEAKHPNMIGGRKKNGQDRKH